MRTRIAMSLFVFSLLTTGQPTWAAALPFTGTLSLRFSLLPPPAVVIAGAGTAIVNGSGGGSRLNQISVPSGAFETMLSFEVTDFAYAPIRGLVLTAGNAAGTFMGSGGVIPLDGFAKVCLFGSCHASFVANLSVPLGVVGAGGVAYATHGANVTVTGAPWTTGTVSNPTRMGGVTTAMGFQRGPASGTSSTALPSGELQLVTPIMISTNISVSAVIPAYAVLRLHFVPEPGTLVLLGAGIVALGAAGRRASG